MSQGIQTGNLHNMRIEKFRGLFKLQQILKSKQFNNEEVVKVQWPPA